MITVTYNGTSYECTTALKGTDYIHLLDSDDNMIVAFDGIVDFSGFSISGGSWATPTATDNCCIATVGDDGVLHKSSLRCCDVASKSSVISTTLTYLLWSGSTAPYTYTLAVTGVTTTSIQEVLPALNITATQLEALQAANIQDGGQSAGSITLKAFGTKPTIDFPIRIVKRGDM